MRLLTSLALIIVCCTATWAQLAPAGNERAETQMISPVHTEVSVFGQASVHDIASPEQKHAFAESVDLDPLRDLAVFHNGRVKIIDTLARETVFTLTGSRRYFDLVPDGDGRVRKARYDPVFTMFDLMIDPAYYANKPLLHVSYLPLREAYLQRALPDDEVARARLMKLTRITPLMVERYSSAIFNEMGEVPEIRRGLGSVERAFEIYLSGERNLLMVAPESRSRPWSHPGELPADSAVRMALAQMGAAWRAMDVEGVNAAVADLASALPAINSEIYPSSRRSLELAYNRSNAFEWGYWAYAASLLMLVLAFGTGRKWLIVGGVSMLIVAIGMHSFGFVARCLIAERFAIQNQFESMTGVSLFAALVGLGIMLVRRQWLFGAAAAGTGFLVLIMATQTGIPGGNIEREAAILNTSVLLKYHVTTVLTSYGLITLGFICSLFYLGTYYAHKLMGAKTDVVAMASQAVAVEGGVNTGPERTLRDLDKAQMTILQLAFWTLGVGILLGAWWADHSWGRWWAFDPKETWALITWIVYLIVIHVRAAGIRNRGLTTAWLSVAGFFVMLWTYFGVNLLLPGLHAYA
ncbi:MAG: hypothetical protein D6695_12005 [Planctomycetota bacterium]|nr:MAG: hypothetical protein D6695_12005 [Planctomycetota bacterium]